MKNDGLFYYEERSDDVVVRVPFGSDFYSRATGLGAKYSKNERWFSAPLDVKEKLDALLLEMFGFVPGQSLVEMTVMNRGPIYFLGTELVVGNIQIARCYGKESHFGLSQWAHLESGPHVDMGYTRQLYFCLPPETSFRLVGVPKELPVEKAGFEIVRIEESGGQGAYVGRGMVTHHG